jgi:hypothetical protein
MSRGPGHLQEAILRSAADAAEKSLTVETLRWVLFENGKPPRRTSPNNLSTGWNTSFRRAVEGLAERRRIIVQRRPLHTFEECVEHYPAKTLQGEARSLRLTFLPVLLEWTREKGGLRPRYDTSANEIHHLRQLRKDRRNVEELRSQWSSLEERLRSIYGNVAKQHSDSLVRLICKGRDLFGIRDVHTSFSFTQLVEGALVTGLLPTDLMNDLRSFVDKFLPQTKADALKLRSFVHELANVPHSGQCTLRSETLKYLHERRRRDVEAMPGFRERKRGFPKSWNKRSSEYEYEYAPQLRKLFDHTVFQNFGFIALS